MVNSTAQWTVKSHDKYCQAVVDTNNSIKEKDIIRPTQHPQVQTKPKDIYMIHHGCKHDIITHEKKIQVDLVKLESNSELKVNLPPELKHKESQSFQLKQKDNASFTHQSMQYSSSQTDIEVQAKDSQTYIEVQEKDCQTYIEVQAKDSDSDCEKDETLAKRRNVKLESIPDNKLLKESHEMESQTTFDMIDQECQLDGHTLKTAGFSVQVTGLLHDAQCNNPVKLASKQSQIGTSLIENYGKNDKFCQKELNDFVDSKVWNEIEQDMKHTQVDSCLQVDVIGQHGDILSDASCSLTVEVRNVEQNTKPTTNTVTSQTVNADIVKANKELQTESAGVTQSNKSCETDISSLRDCECHVTESKRHDIGFQIIPSSQDFACQLNNDVKSVSTSNNTTLRDFYIESSSQTTTRLSDAECKHGTLPMTDTAVQQYIDNLDFACQISALSPCFQDAASSPLSVSLQSIGEQTHESNFYSKEKENRNESAQTSYILIDEQSQSVRVLLETFDIATQINKIIQNDTRNKSCQVEHDDLADTEFSNKIKCGLLSHESIGCQQEDILADADCSMTVKTKGKKQSAKPTTNTIDIQTMDEDTEKEMKELHFKTGDASCQQNNILKDDVCSLDIETKSKKQCAKPITNTIDLQTFNEKFDKQIGANVIFQSNKNCETDMSILIDCECETLTNEQYDVSCQVFPVTNDIECQNNSNDLSISSASQSSMQSLVDSECTYSYSTTNIACQIKLEKFTDTNPIQVENYDNTEKLHVALQKNTKFNDAECKQISIAMVDKVTQQTVDNNSFSSQISEQNMPSIDTSSLPKMDFFEDIEDDIVIKTNLEVKAQSLGFHDKLIQTTSILLDNQCQFDKEMLMVSSMLECGTQINRDLLKDTECQKTVKQKSKKFQVDSYSIGYTNYIDQICQTDIERTEFKQKTDEIEGSKKIVSSAEHLNRSLQDATCSQVSPNTKSFEIQTTIATIKTKNFTTQVDTKFDENAVCHEKDILVHEKPDSKEVSSLPNITLEDTECSNQMQFIDIDCDYMIMQCHRGIQHNFEKDTVDNQSQTDSKLLFIPDFIDTHTHTDTLLDAECESLIRKVETEDVYIQVNLESSNNLDAQVMSSPKCLDCECFQLIETQTKSCQVFKEILNSSAYFEINNALSESGEDLETITSTNRKPLSMVPTMSSANDKSMEMRPKLKDFSSQSSDVEVSNASQSLQITSNTSKAIKSWQLIKEEHERLTASTKMEARNFGSQMAKLLIDNHLKLQVKSDLKDVEIQTVRVPLVDAENVYQPIPMSTMHSEFTIHTMDQIDETSIVTNDATEQITVEFIDFGEQFCVENIDKVSQISRNLIDSGIQMIIENDSKEVGSNLETKDVALPDEKYLSMSDFTCQSVKDVLKDEEVDVTLCTTDFASQVACAVTSTYQQTETNLATSFHCQQIEYVHLGSQVNTYSEFSQEKSCQRDIINKECGNQSDIVLVDSSAQTSFILVSTCTDEFDCDLADRAEVYLKSADSIEDLNSINDDEVYKNRITRFTIEEANEYSIFNTTHESQTETLAANSLGKKVQVDMNITGKSDKVRGLVDPTKADNIPAFDEIGAPVKVSRDNVSQTEVITFTGRKVQVNMIVEDHENHSIKNQTANLDTILNEETVSMVNVCSQTEAVQNLGKKIQVDILKMSSSYEMEKKSNSSHGNGVLQPNEIPVSQASCQTHSISTLGKKVQVNIELHSNGK